jgi:hypothetical protein
MPDSQYSLTDLYLPERKKLTSLLKRLSFFLGLSVLVICVFYLLSLPFLAPVQISLLALVAFILAVTSLLTDKLISTLSGVLVLLTGVFQLSSGFSVGICFILISVALILPRLKINRRFRPSQLLILLVLIVNAVSVLGHTYQAFSHFPSTLALNPLNISLIFIFLCISAAFHWPGRGFLGVFTTDTVSSMFALRLLMANMFIVFILGLLVLLVFEHKLLDPRDALALFIIVIIVLSSFLSWLNIKLLYKFELERFVMKEELRIHNIRLKLGNEDLTAKMSELKQANQEYAGKLKYRDIISNLD